MDNLDEMDKFLEIYSLPKLNKEESENLNKPIITNEVEALIKKIPTALAGVAQWIEHRLQTKGSPV